MRYSDHVFDDVHRAQNRRITSIVFGWVAAGAIVVASMVAVGSANAQPAPDNAAIPFDVAAATAWAPSPKAAAAPAPAATPTPVLAAPTALTATRPAGYTIHITASGYQAELDACQWVRMDLLPTVPLVGAHTRCGGALVLRLHDGDSVRLFGEGLDGTFRVVSSRDAHSGDDAATATAGMDAAIILQTCYPGSSGRVRLVGIVPA